MQHFDTIKPVKNNLIRSAITFIALFLFSTLPASKALANTYMPNTFADPAITTVNNATGEINGGSTISLRSALMAADNLGGTHTVTLSSGTYSLTQALPNRQIVLGNTAQNITINGNGPVNTIIDMVADADKDRIFLINPTGSVTDIYTTFTGISFTHGYSASDNYGGAAIYAGGFGIQSLTITNCSFENNTVPLASGGQGGAINMLLGTLSINNSTFTNNNSFESDGGAIYYLLLNSDPADDGAVSITNCTFSGNTAAGNGGAISFITQPSLPIGQTFSLNISKNKFLNNSATGFGGAVSGNNLAAVSTPTINYNRFVGNTSTASASTSGLHFIHSPGSINAENNWWGCNFGPTASPCDKAGSTGTPASGSLDANPWLQLKTTASPNPICNTASGTGNVTTITASFLSNSDNAAIAAVNLTALVGLPVTWSSSLGTLGAPQELTIQADGEAINTFTSNGTAGNGSAGAKVDNIPPTDTDSRVTITINATPTVTNPSNVTGLCAGGTAVFTTTVTGNPTSIQWRKGTTALVNGLQGSGSTVAGAGTSALTITNVQPGDAAANYNVQATNNCGTATSADAALTVTATNTIALSSATGTNAQTVCINSAITNTTYSTTGATGATFSGLPAGVGGTWAANVVTISGTPTVSGNFSYTVTLTGGCGTISASGSITVNPRPAISTVTVTQPTCALPTGTISINATGSGILEYSINGGSTWLPTNSFSGLAAGNYNIAVRSQSYPLCVTAYSSNPVVLNAATGCCSPVNSGTIASGNQTICNGGNPSNITFSIAPSGGAVGGSFNYQWYYQNGLANPCPSGTSTTGWTLISGATGNSYDPPSGLTTSRTYAVTVDPTGTPDCGVATWANSCRKITVYNAVVATCSTNNTSMYFGYSGDQSATIKAIATGGTAPYTVSITMNRPLNCNVITSAGDELWAGVGGTNSNNVCPATGPGLTPVSTGTVAASGGFYSVNVTLMQDATFTATITDANGCVSTCTVSVHAEDARCFAGNSGNAKVKICHKTGNGCHEICVSSNAVSAHLGHGDFLGDCTPDCEEVLYAKAVVTEKAPVKPAVEMLDVMVAPNPAETQFTLFIETASKEKISFVLYDVFGRVVKRTENKGGTQQIMFGEELKAGMYMVEVIQGSERKVIKLVKLN